MDHHKPIQPSQKHRRAPETEKQKLAEIRKAAGAEELARRDGQPD